jgi:hypothetical protein
MYTGQVVTTGRGRGTVHGVKSWGSQGNLALFFLSRHPADWNSHLIALVAVREQFVGRGPGPVCPFCLIPLLGGGVAADSAGGGGACGLVLA